MRTGLTGALASAVAAAALGLGLVGGGQRAAAEATTGLHGLTPLTLTPPPWLRPAPLHPGVGATQRVDAGGARLNVTLTRVIDPLRGAGAALAPGTRAVGVLVRIVSAGPALYDSSATGDFSLVASAGVVTPAFARHGVCRTPLNDFDRYITAGETRSGCVVFAVATHARVLAVRFSPHARARGRLTWSP